MSSSNWGQAEASPTLIDTTRKSLYVCIYYVAIRHPRVHHARACVICSSHARAVNIAAHVNQCSREIEIASDGLDQLHPQYTERLTNNIQYTLGVQAASKGSGNSWAYRNKAIVVSFSFWWVNRLLITRKSQVRVARNERTFYERSCADHVFVEKRSSRH